VFLCLCLVVSLGFPAWVWLCGVPRSRLGLVWSPHSPVWPAVNAMRWGWTDSFCLPSEALRYWETELFVSGLWTSWSLNR